MLRYLPTAALLAGLLALAACNGQQPAQAHPPTDVGNMAYPTPLSQGNVTTTTRP